MGASQVSQKDETINITPKQSGYNEAFFNLTGVTAKYGSETKTNTESDKSFNFKKLNTLESLKLTKDGFRDYIIPYNVVNSMTDGTNLDAYMSLDKKDGKPYISSVFGKDSNKSEYQDLFKSSITAEYGNKYDIVVTAVGVSGSATYTIKQDSKHYLTSKTGVFSAVDLFSKLDLKKEVYVYVTDSKGKTSDLEKVKISKSTDDGSLTKILNASTYSLGGSGGVTIKIPDENPIFGNSTISLKAFSAPLTTYYDATNGTYIATIGWDLYSYTKTDKTAISSSTHSRFTTIGDGETKKAYQNFKESFGYLNKKPFAKDEKDKNGKSYKEQWNSLVNRCKTASKYSTATKDKNFSADFLGYLEFAITEQGFVIKEANLKVGAEFSYSYTYQGAVWVIPAYFKATLGASAALEGSAKRSVVDTNLPFEFEIALGIEPSLALEAGIGVEKLAKAGVEAKGTAPLNIEFKKKHITLDFTGEINIKTKAFIFSWDKKLIDGTINVLDKYWGSTKASAPAKLLNIKDPMSEEVLNFNRDDNGVESIIDRDYAENTSEWFGQKSSFADRMKAKSVSTDSVSIKQLQTSVFEDGKPVTVSIGDKMLMAWIEDDVTRDEYNRMRLMYSVYDGTSWSKPNSVYDNGMNDDAPVIVSDGKKVYFAWQKIAETLDKNATAAKALQKVDIYTAEYNSDKGVVENVQRIATDGYDYAQCITIENGAPVVYFANCADETVATSFNSKIYKVTGNKKTVIVSDLPYVQTITASDSMMNYVVDTDNQLDTFEDINIVSYSEGKSNQFDKSDLETAFTSSYYGTIDGEKILFASDGANIYYWQNGEFKTVFSNSHNISNLNILNSDDNCLFTWTETTESGDEVYCIKYGDDGWSEPYTIATCENYYVDHLSIAEYDGKMLGVFMQDEFDPDSESNSITQANLAYMVASDFYDISVECLTVDEEDIVPGQTAKMSVYVKNNGSQPVNNVSFKINDGIINSQTVITDVNLNPGEADNITVNYEVPEKFKRTTLTVSAELSDYTDKDKSNNEAELEIGVPDFKFVKYDLAEDGDYYVVTVYVENQSQTASENLTTQLYLNEDEGDINYISEIGSLANDEIGMTQFYVEKNVIEFDESGNARLYCKFIDEDSKFGSSVTECMVITKSSAVCAHPETELIEGIPATCIATGLTEGTKCLGCGEVIVKQETIAKTDHIPSVWITDKDSNCKDGGTKHKECTVCHTTLETADIPLAQHQYKSVVTKPTCTVDGYTTHTCSVCGDSYTDNIIKATGHSYDNGKVTKSATCTSTGTKTYTCSCGDTY
ncbi:MAG: hypothetical protein NC122_10560, partial [Faecalibacterium sp.]|nr:hypothetical protein [Ruminococcus sp.]MCM1486631.1 hypothetical protein [Faecalibacterium sp.]